MKFILFLIILVKLTCYHNKTQLQLKIPNQLPYIQSGIQGNFTDYTKFETVMLNLKCTRLQAKEVNSNNIVIPFNRSRQ